MKVGFLMSRKMILVCLLLLFAFSIGCSDNQEESKVSNNTSSTYNNNLPSSQPPYNDLASDRSDSESSIDDSSEHSNSKVTNSNSSLESHTDNSKDNIMNSNQTSESESSIIDADNSEDITALEHYFESELKAKDIKISQSNVQLYGTSLGWRIYSASYDGQLHMEALCSDTIGGYTFYKNIQYLPYPIAIFAVKDGTVYTLKEAYNKKLINIEEVYAFVPEEIKKIH